MDANLLVGTWRLVSWESRDADGLVSYPFGRDPPGYLIYTADGYMSATLTPADRPHFAAGDLLRGSEVEQAGAAATCIAYAGALAVPQLRREAQLDAKTGLAAPRHFDALLATEIARARRAGRPLALLMADLDCFKALNDSHGHLAGDAVLADVARIVLATLRRGDVAGRFGGEEFAVLLRETDTSTACAVAERLRLAVAATHFAVQGSAMALRTTMSIGVASFPRDGDTPVALLRAADAAAYRAKAAGRNCVATADGMVMPATPQTVPLTWGTTAEASRGKERRA